MDVSPSVSVSVKIIVTIDQLIVILNDLIDAFHGLPLAPSLRFALVTSGHYEGNWASYQDKRDPADVQDQPNCERDWEKETAAAT